MALAHVQVHQLIYVSISIEFDFKYLLGDPQEMNAITEVFCNQRQNSLLIGSTKSNMGHPEPASGVAALAKLLVAIQSGHLPGNYCKFSSMIYICEFISI